MYTIASLRLACNDALMQRLQVLYVTAVLAKDKKKSGFFEAPCYRVKKRTGLNYITNFMLKTDEDRAKWILRGVALLCSTD
jgi:dynein heavy chain